MPPVAPANVVATPAAPNLVNISWDPVPGASAYQILRSASPTGPFSQVGMAAGNADNSYHSATPPGGTYYFVVKTYAGGVFSGPSAVVSAPLNGTPAMQVPPGAPRDLTAVLDAGMVKLDWKPSLAAVPYRYEIHRGTSPGALAPIDAGPTGVSRYTDANPPAGGVYYAVIAVGAYGQAVSAEVFIAT